MADVRSEVSGNVWKVEVSVGQAVAEGEQLIIVESMKMEIPIDAPCSGTVARILVREGDSVQEGAVVAVLR